MNFKIPPSMAGRKTKLTPERQEKILGCVRAGMSYKDAAQSAGITPETLCRWIARGKVESGLFYEFYESVRKALVHFELVHLDNIERSALGESKIIQQTGEIQGRRNPKRPVERRAFGGVNFDTIVAYLTFRQATVILYKLDKNGPVCDLVLPSDPRFSREMLKSPDFLRRIRKTLLAAGHPVGEFGHPRPTA